MRGNSHARCGAGEKPEEIECGLRPHSNTKGLPIAIVPGGDPERLERTSESAFPQRAVYRHHPGQRTADHCGQGRDHCGNDPERKKKPQIHRIEAPA